MNFEALDHMICPKWIAIRLPGGAGLGAASAAALESQKVFTSKHNIINLLQSTLELRTTYCAALLKLQNMSLQIPHREKKNGASTATKAVILVSFP